MVTKVCPQCNKEFQIKKYVNVTGYCSKKCQRQHSADKRRKPVAQWMKDIDDMLATAHLAIENEKE